MSYLEDNGTFTFDGVNSADYGVWITGANTYSAPPRRFEEITIPGKNGVLTLDQRSFEDIEHTYPAFIRRNFPSNIEGIRNQLLSRSGKKVLTDSYHPDEFYLAKFMQGVDVEVGSRAIAGRFDLVFKRDPRRFLKSGETPVTIGEWGETTEHSGSIATFEAVDSDAVKSLKVALEPVQDLHGYDRPWADGAGKNKLVLTINDVKSANPGGAWNGNVCTISEMTYTLNVNDGGNVESITINGTTTSYPMLRIPIKELVEGQSYRLFRDGFRSRLLKDNTLISDGSFDYTFTAESGTYRVALFTGATTISNVTVQPMVCLATEADPTFAPYSNICPISGHDSVEVTRTGKNLIENAGGSKTISGVTFTMNDDGTVTANGTATAQIQYFVFGTTVSSSADKKFAEDVIVSTGQIGSATTYRGVVWSAYSSGQMHNYFIDSSDITIPANSTIFGFAIRIMNGVTVDNVVFKPMIRLATDTDQTFEPYQGETYTTDLGGTYYGGTLDVASGVLTVDRAMVDLGTQTWNANSGGFYANIDYSSNDVKYSICEQYAFIPTANDTTASAMASKLQNGEYAWYVNLKRIFIKDSAYNDATAFKTAMNGVQLVYELDTPQTIQLTPQQVALLAGTNNIWSDSGDVTVEVGTNPNMLVNPTLFASKPLIRVTGYGTLTVGSDVITIAQNFAYVDIDSEVGDCYHGTDNANASVSFQQNDFPELAPGATGIAYSGHITKVEITPRWWRL